MKTPPASPRLRALAVLLGAALATAPACTNTDNNAPVVAAGTGGTQAPPTGLDGGGGGDVPLIGVDEPGYLWFAGGALHAFTRSQTKASGDRAPGVLIVPNYPANGFHDLAFDAAGNLWALPHAGDRILRLPAARLGATVPPAPDLVITSAALRSAQSLAFDADGNLWVMSYAGAGLSVGTIARFDGVQAMSGPGPVTVTPAATVGPGDAPESVARFSQGTSIAVDGAGNLWLGAVANILRFDGASRLSGDVSPTPAVIISTGEAYVSIAFDAGGSLWITAARAGYSAIRIDAPGSLTGIVSPTPAAKLLLPSANELFAGGMTFDADGALWVAMSHKILRFPDAHALTGESSGPADVTLGLTQGPDLASKLVIH